MINAIYYNIDIQIADTNKRKYILNNCDVGGIGPIKFANTSNLDKIISKVREDAFEFISDSVRYPINRSKQYRIFDIRCTIYTIDLESLIVSTYQMLKNSYTLIQTETYKLDTFTDGYIYIEQCIVGLRYQDMSHVQVLHTYKELRCMVRTDIERFTCCDPTIASYKIHTNHIGGPEFALYDELSLVEYDLHTYQLNMIRQCGIEIELMLNMQAKPIDLYNKLMQYVPYEYTLYDSNGKPELSMMGYKDIALQDFMNPTHFADMMCYRDEGNSILNWDRTLMEEW